MTWEQAFDALQSIGIATLKMRAPGNWYVEQSVEIVEGTMLVGKHGNGTTPQAAVEDHWKIYSDRSAIVRLSGGATVTWTGYMWREVTPASRKESR